MQLEKITIKPKKITGNLDFDKWLTHLGYDQKTIKNLSCKEHDPSLLEDVEKATSLLLPYFKNKELIIVSGDYDADGICGTTILVQGLMDLGANVDFMIPSRSEGYGMNVNMVQKAIDSGAKVIVTVDNGISCHEAIDYAKKHGLVVIVTDHHTISEKGLPNADVVLHPSKYPFRDISGATVAYKFISYMLSTLQPKTAKFRKERLEYYRALAGITVISDVMPLVNENRTIFKETVKFLKAKKDDNLNHLLEVAKVSLDTLNEIDFGFSICPLINAVGRIENPESGVQFFLSNSLKERQSRGAILYVINEKRKELNKIQLANIQTLVDNTHSGIVIFNESFDIHEGLIGIIAGRICNEYGKPTILFTKTKNSNGDDIWKASARSIDEVNIYSVLKTIEKADPSLLINYGGHAGAAGLSIPYDKKEEFEDLFYKEVSEEFEEQIVSYLDVEVQNIDALLSAMETLAPFGQGFPKPIIRTNFELQCAKCYFGSERSVWTNDVFEIWKELDETLNFVHNNNYRCVWTNYDKLLLEGDPDPTANKTEFYRPMKGTINFELIASVTNNWFGGNKKPQLEVIKMEEL